MLREVILENFMSYEYARVPLKPGVNLVCGPNGAGKSSLLLGICVALGESYTERSRRLSDLVRWGEEAGRVTLVIDNSPVDGVRPVPSIDRDTILLTRVLRSDGRYWFELNNRYATKAEVVELLSKVGFNPDNMLVVMHQNMPERFAALPPHEKLRVVEQAVGFDSYRRDVLEAMERLRGVMSEEEELSRLLRSAKETLDYWREKYERWREKVRLRSRLEFLQRELAWARVYELETVCSELRAEVDRLEGEMEETSRKMEEERVAVSAIREVLSNMRSSFLNGLDRMAKLERRIGVAEGEAEALRRVIRKFGDRSLKADVEGAVARAETLRAELLALREELDRLWEGIHGKTERLVEESVRLAVLESRLQDLERSLKAVRRKLRDRERRLADALGEASKLGERVETGRSVQEIMEDISLVRGQISAMADVTSEAEEMYNLYVDRYGELVERAEKLKAKKAEVMGEVEARVERWREVVRELVRQVNARYQAIMAMLDASGEVRLVNDDDIESAGIEITAGFRGAEPSLLDAYVHSGGERSTAVMAFLLALQQNIKSPFRAVDEFDLHLDPRNRQAVMEALVKVLKGQRSQYLAITPSEVSIPEGDIHIIMVQKVGGKSVATSV